MCTSAPDCSTFTSLRRVSQNTASGLWISRKRIGQAGFGVSLSSFDRLFLGGGATNLAREKKSLAQPLIRKLLLARCRQVILTGQRNCQKFMLNSKWLLFKLTQQILFSHCSWNKPQRLLVRECKSSNTHTTNTKPQTPKFKQTQMNPNPWTKKIQTPHPNPHTQTHAPNLMVSFSWSKTFCISEPAILHLNKIRRQRDWGLFTCSVDMPTSLSPEGRCHWSPGIPNSGIFLCVQSKDIARWSKSASVRTACLWHFCGESSQLQKKWGCRWHKRPLWRYLAQLKYRWSHVGCHCRAVLLTRSHPFWNASIWASISGKNQFFPAPLSLCFWRAMVVWVVQ